jgi:hypothetical protein
MILKEGHRVKSKEYIQIKCNHCCNKTPMEVVLEYSQVKDYEDERSGIGWEAGPIWKFVICPACSGLNIIRLGYHSAFDPDEWSLNVIYPIHDDISFEGLTSEVEKEYKAALKVRNISSNAYAALLGRVIDKVCIDRGAEGDSFYKRIQSLADKGEIPKRLAEMFHQLRLLRNIGAHADLGELTTEEIPILDSLCKAILEYVYTAPRLINQVEKHIQNLKAIKKKIE